MKSAQNDEQICFGKGLRNADFAGRDLSDATSKNAYSLAQGFRNAGWRERRLNRVNWRMRSSCRRL